MGKGLIMLLQKIKLSILVILMGIISFSGSYAAEVYYDNFDTFENMLRSADLIFVGNVVNTQTVEEPYKNLTQITRYSEFNIEEIVSNKVDYQKQKIIIKTIDLMLENGENVLAHIPQKAQKGMQYIALVEKRDNNYYLMSLLQNLSIHRVFGL